MKPAASHDTHAAQAALPPRRLPRALAHVSDLAARHNGGVRFVLENKTYLLFFHPAIPLERPRLRLRLELGAARLQLDLDRPFLGDFLGGLLDGERSESLPREVLLGAFEYACHFVADALEATAGVPVTLIDIVPPEAPGPDNTWRLPFEARHEDGTVALRCAVHFDAPAAPVLRRLLRAAPATRTPLPASLPVPAAVVLGEVVLTVAEWRGLAVGDILFCDAPRAARPKAAILRVSARRGFACTLSGNAITILNPLGVLMEQDDKGVPLSGTGLQRDEEAAHPAALAGLEEIEVQVRFEAGSVCLSLGELTALGPGAVIELGGPVDRPLAIMVNGKRLGSGELLDLDGRTAVRVLEIHQP